MFSAPFLPLPCSGKTEKEHPWSLLGEAKLIGEKLNCGVE